MGRISTAVPLPEAAARAAATGDAELHEVLARTTAAALAVSGAEPGRVFEDLALGLAQVLDTDAALIAEFVDDRHMRMRTVALAFEGRLLKQIEYDVSQTPCRHVVGHASRFVPSGVNPEFARGTLFAEKGFDAYAGYPIHNDAGEQLGIIVALDREPIANQELTEALLKIFAVRAAAEMERLRAAAALAASETSYRAIFEANEDAIFVHDWDTGAILDVSPKASEIYGFACEDLRRMRVGDFSANVPPYTEVEAIAYVESAKASDGPLRFEWHAKHRDGHLMWHEVTLKRAEIAGQARVLAFVRDITERKRAEEALRTSEEQYREIFNASADALVLWDSQYRRVDVNLAYQRLYGWKREEVIGRGYEHPVFPPKYSGPRRELVRRALAGEHCNAELEAIRSDGSRLWTEVHAIPFRHRGEPHVLAIARDITERKGAEEALRASEAQYRAIFNASADALVLRDADFRIVDVNETYERMSGWTRNEVLGIDRIVANPPEVAAKVQALHARALAGETVALEVPLVRRDGMRYELELRGVPIQHRGQPHVLYMGRDVTERRRAEDALRASEEQYRAIFEAATDSLQLIDAEHRVVDVNPAYERMYAKRRDDVVGRTLDELVPEALRSERRALIERALAGSTAELQTIAFRSDGSSFDLEVRVIPFQHRGQPHVLGIARDITERKRAEEALRLREEQYRVVFEGSADAIVLWDRNVRIVDVNKAFTQLYGYSREEVVDGGFGQRISGEGRSQRVEMIRRALAGQEGVIETEGVKKNGERFDVELRYLPIVHRGEPHVLAIGRDISARRQVEGALRASEEQYRAIFNASADAMLLRDETLTIVDANPAFQALCGLPRDQVVGRAYAPFVIAGYEEAAERLLRDAVNGVRGTLEARTRRSDGQEIDVEVRAMPMLYQGRPHVLAIARNITPEKRAEAERARYESRLRQAQKMEAIGQLTGGIAHDFNNILASVMGYVVLAEERVAAEADSKTTEYLAQALASCRRARDLIQQMLTFSRGGRGEPRAVSLAALVREALPMLRSALPATLALEVDVNDSAPSVWIDEVQAHQVLLNLAINARDAMPEGGALNIDVRQAELHDALCASCRGVLHGRFVELVVADRGPGIDPGLLERIFDPFFTTKAPGKGSGMGLSMVHGIVHEHGGHVVVESDWGQGSRFRILLPEYAAAPRVPGAAPANSAARHSLQGRVLAVDDEPSVLAIMRETLTSWGLEVEACGSVDAAERAFGRNPGAFDLLLTDYAMPAATGIELAERLRRRRADLPWLLCTGFADADTVERARRAGADAVLRKPVERDELRTAVESALVATPLTPYTAVPFEQFESEALAAGFDEVVERRWEANAILDTHRHPFGVGALMVAGDLWLTIGEETRHLRPGDRFEIPRNEPHAERYGTQGAVFWIARRHRP